MREPVTPTTTGAVAAQPFSNERREPSADSQKVIRATLRASERNPRLRSERNWINDQFVLERLPLCPS